MKKNTNKVLIILLVLCLAVYVPAVMAEDFPVDQANSEQIQDNSNFSGDDSQNNPAPDEDPAEDDSQNTPAPDEDPAEDDSQNTPAPDEEPAEDDSQNTPAPDEEPAEDDSQNTPAPDEEPAEDDSASADINNDGVIDGVEVKLPPLEMVNPVTIITPEPELSVDMAFDEETYAPGEIAYGSLTIKNNGPISLSEVVIQCDFPKEEVKDERRSLEMYGGGLEESNIASLALGEEIALPVWYWIPHSSEEGQLDLDVTVTVYYQGESIVVSPEKDSSDSDQTSSSDSDQTDNSVVNQTDSSHIEQTEEPDSFVIQSLPGTSSDSESGKFYGEYSLTLKITLNIAGEPNWLIESGPAKNSVNKELLR